mgnify:CR=1 FL=1
MKISLSSHEPLGFEVDEESRGNVPGGLRLQLHRGTPKKREVINIAPGRHADEVAIACKDERGDEHRIIIHLSNDPQERAKQLGYEYAVIRTATSFGLVGADEVVTVEIDADVDANREPVDHDVIVLGPNGRSRMIEKAVRSDKAR